MVNVNRYHKVQLDVSKQNRIMTEIVVVNLRHDNLTFKSELTNMNEAGWLNASLHFK